MTAYQFLMYSVSPFLVALLYRCDWERHWKVITSFVIIATLHVLALFLDGRLTYPLSSDFWLELAMAYGIQQGTYQLMPSAWLKIPENIDLFAGLDAKSGTKPAYMEDEEHFNSINRRLAHMSENNDAVKNEGWKVTMPQNDQKSTADEQAVMEKESQNAQEETSFSTSDGAPADSVQTEGGLAQPSGTESNTTTEGGLTGESGGMTNSVGVGSGEGGSGEASNGATSGAVGGGLTSTSGTGGGTTSGS